MENERLLQEIYNFIKDEMNNSHDFDISTNIIEEKLVDSMSILALVNFLEEQFAVEIDLDEITPDNFSNVRSIAEFAGRLQKSGLLAFTEMGLQG